MGYIQEMSKKKRPVRKISFTGRGFSPQELELRKKERRLYIAALFFIAAAAVVRSILTWGTDFYILEDYTGPWW